MRPESKSGLSLLKIAPNFCIFLSPCAPVPSLLCWRNPIARCTFVCTKLSLPSKRNKSELLGETSFLRKLPQAMQPHHRIIDDEATKQYENRCNYFLRFRPSLSSQSQTCDSNLLDCALAYSAVKHIDFVLSRSFTQASFQTL